MTSAVWKFRRNQGIGRLGIEYSTGFSAPDLRALGIVGAINAYPA